jgi:hypothetical protein
VPQIYINTLRNIITSEAKPGFFRLYAEIDYEFVKFTEMGVGCIYNLAFLFLKKIEAN